MITFGGRSRIDWLNTVPGTVPVNYGIWSRARSLLAGAKPENETNYTSLGGTRVTVHPGRNHPLMMGGPEPDSFSFTSERVLSHPALAAPFTDGHLTVHSHTGQSRVHLRTGDNLFTLGDPEAQKTAFYLLNRVQPQKPGQPTDITARAFEIARDIDALVRRGGARQPSSIPNDPTRFWSTNDGDFFAISQRKGGPMTAKFTTDNRKGLVTLKPDGQVIDLPISTHPLAAILAPYPDLPPALRSRNKAPLSLKQSEPDSSRNNT